MRHEHLPISVVIPSYRRPELVRRAVSSVVRQRSRPAEILVVDDGSGDGTAEAAEAAGASVIRHSQNRGCAAARNTGVEAASQPWIALLDSDDQWLPHHLATLWPLRGGHAIAAMSALRCGDDPAADRFFGPIARGPVVLSSPAAIMFPANVLFPSATIVRREAILDAGGFDTRRRYSEDFDLWLRLLERGTAIVSPQVTVLYHQHGEQKSKRASGPRETKRAIEAQYAGRAWWSPRLVERRLARERWDDLRSDLRAGRYGEAARAALRLIRPRDLRAVVTTWRWRFAVRRRSSTVARDGRLTVAVWGGGAALRRRVEAATAGWPLVDLGGRRDLMRALMRLLRRPTGVAVVGSPVEGALATALGVRPLRDRADLSRALAEATYSEDLQRPGDDAGPVAGGQLLTPGGTPVSAAARE